MKPFWQSKTLYVNIIAAGALFLQNQYGYVLPPEVQGYILIAINLVLRTITSQGLSLS